MWEDDLTEHENYDEKANNYCQNDSNRPFFPFDNADKTNNEGSYRRRCRKKHRNCENRVAEERIPTPLSWGDENIENSE